ncbi:hypothetical protein [Gorillibacterium massiliense]|uniref:hypothetical protein n=1 Tax=Gorillibacterium massiliense TaxID=1280390 RepID=UPI0004B02FD6|nr:hypothetical protein [Gorillibacterium massiliense]
MKKRLAAIGIGLVLIVGLTVLNYWGPYNVVDALTAKNLLEFDEIQQKLDGKIISIKYVGRDTYKVHTEKKDYILVDNNSDYSFLRFKVYEADNEIEIFKNPM